MIINQKIELTLDDKSKNILDSQSRMCSKVYNELLELCINDKENRHHYLLGRNLRNEVVNIKRQYPYLYSVFSSPLKNAALRLKQAYDNYFISLNKEHKIGHPKFHSNKIKWFSLFYDEPNKGIKINKRNVRISLGYKLDENNKKIRLYVNGILKDSIKNNAIVKNYRITKELNKYYLIVCLDVTYNTNHISKDRVIAIDPNHTNFFVGIDNKGNSIELAKLDMIKYFDKQIDKVKSKKDKCLKKSKEFTNDDGTKYYISSRRYQRLEYTLNKLYLKRKSQLKTALYTIANRLCDNYDKIVIGDYTPTLDTAKYKTMHRAMLNQSPIAEFRKILEFVGKKRGVCVEIIDEALTTKTCCICHHIESHDPSIRSFICPNCNKTLYRDINSAINIGVKANLLSGSDYVSLDLSKPTYIARYDLYKQGIVY